MLNKALKIHKANEKLAKQNYQLKTENQELRTQLENGRGNLPVDAQDNKSITFQNQSINQDLESTEKKNKE